MRLIQLTLIDLALTLLAPEITEAMDVGSRANFALATKAVALFKRVVHPQAVLSSGDRRHFYSRTTQAVQFVPADSHGKAKLAESSAICLFHRQARAAAFDCHDPRWRGDAQDARCADTIDLQSGRRKLWLPRSGDAALEQKRLSCRRHGDHRLCAILLGTMEGYSTGAGT
ncbi:MULTISPECIES: hypothetical protein [unclassified Bradyrhizobium]|uniref:hypothetical protein n=1 Tax=unclassified Bradyrhizobium TaxID=2631580 RepID=UPI003D1F6EF4